MKHLVECKEFIGCTLEVSTIVRMRGPWSPYSSDEPSQGSKKCLSSQTIDYFNVDCLGVKANKYSNITLNDGFATGCSDSEGNWSSIIYSCVEEWSRWLDSC